MGNMLVCFLAESWGRSIPLSCLRAKYEDDDFASEIMPFSVCCYLKQTFRSANTSCSSFQQWQENQCVPHWSYLVSVPLPPLSHNGCISMLPVMSDWFRQGVQAVTPGSGTEGPGKMWDLSANRVCLYTVTEGGTLSVSVWGWDHRIRMCLTLFVIV